MKFTRRKHSHEIKSLPISCEAWSRYIPVTRQKLSCVREKLTDYDEVETIAQHEERHVDGMWKASRWLIHEWNFSPKDKALTTWNSGIEATLNGLDDVKQQFIDYVGLAFWTKREQDEAHNQNILEKEKSLLTHIRGVFFPSSRSFPCASQPTSSNSLLQIFLLRFCVYIYYLSHWRWALDGSAQEVGQWVTSRTDMWVRVDVLDNHFLRFGLGWRRKSSVRLTITDMTRRVIIPGYRRLSCSTKRSCASRRLSLLFTSTLPCCMRILRVLAKTRENHLTG